MVCARLPGSTLSKNILDASWGSLRVLIASRSLWPGTGGCISPTTIFNDLLFKVAIRRDRPCILVSGLLDAFVTAFNLRRTNHCIGLNFKELMCGRIETMTAQCLAWAHTYLSMCQC